MGGIIEKLARVNGAPHDTEGSHRMTEAPTRRLTLSLDNGPDPELTPRVLDVLTERSTRAVFFLVGQKGGTPAGREWPAR
jgi:peptidoglycan/xylan/chitin deacetylase (PgdA/CDA1 family)